MQTTRMEPLEVSPTPAGCLYVEHCRTIWPASLSQLPVRHKEALVMVSIGKFDR